MAPRATRSKRSSTPFGFERHGLLTVYEKAESLDCDYLGVSPVFATPTKTDTKEPWGLDGLAKIRAFSRHPLVAIGGLHAGNAEAAVRAGADSIAVVSAICASPDPLQASRELAGIIRAALEKRGDAGGN